MRLVATVFEVIAFLAGLIGLWVVFDTMAAPGVSAPQQAAGVAFGISVAIIPYCIAGVFHRGAVREMMISLLAKD